MARQQSKETFREKFSKIFSKGGPIKRPPSANQKFEEFLITPALVKELSQETPLNQRVKVIRDMCDLVTTKRLEDNGIETLWLCISDLLDPKLPTESRHLVLNFIKCIIMGQHDRLGLMREHFFNILRNHSIFEDLPLRLDLFRALSDHGKNLLDFEEETGPFLLQWMPDVISYGRTCEFLNLLVNVIKFNSCYLDDNIVTGLVQHTCTVCNRTDKVEDIDQSLKVLDAVICYSCLPTESLYHFITALCRTVSLPKFCEPSWKLMRNLLGTHLGHSAIYIMCCTMESSDNIQDVILVRGAVFYVGMACWGSKRVPSLKHNFTSVLPSFGKALAGKSPVVAYEVTLSLHRLVTKYGKDIQPVTWEIILGIVEELFENIQMYEQTHEYLPNQLHDLLSTVEMLHENQSFLGSASKLFAIIEAFATLRPERSVLSLIAFRAQSIHPTKADWIQNLQNLMNRYFQKEHRTSVREATLRVLSSVLSSTSHLYEDDLIELVVLPQLGHITDDPDPRVRNMAVQLLVDVAQVCQTQRCQDILDIIKKVVEKPLHTKGSWLASSANNEKPMPGNIAADDTDLVDIKTAVVGLLELLRTKLHRLPSTHAVRAFELLVTHMQSQYANNYESEIACEIRALVFQCLLELRADNLCRLGLPQKDGTMKFSPYIICDSRMEMDLTTKMSPTPTCTSPPPTDRYCKTTGIPFAEAFKTLTLCLIKETDWRVLLQVLKGLATALQNKKLLVAANANLDRLCGTLCSMIGDSSHIRNLQQNSKYFNRADYYEQVYRVLTAVVPYHNLLENRQQVDLVKCLETGLKLKCHQQCVDGLTLCVIEMQDIMVKILPSIILQMSKMSTTQQMAIPVLEFLFSLIWFPSLYASFVEDQYMSIFAVALHYTNPFKFNLYIVSLAHHVIAMWFIKCRLPFRKAFVNCIVRGLRANVAPIHLMDSYQSRLRGRRGSNYNEKPNLNMLGSSPKKGKGSSVKEEKKEPPIQSMEEMLYELHQLLTETCMDMMARYTFSNCTTVPKRSPVTEFLLAGGQSQSWLLGNKLITITTSGGSSRAQKNGVCEKCNQLIERERSATMDSSMSQLEDAEKEDDDAFAEDVHPLQKKFPRVRRQRSKSGNTHQVDSAGNVLPQKVLKKEDSAEVNHLSLLSSVKEEISNMPLQPKPPPPSPIDQSQDSLQSVISQKSDPSREASKVTSREASKPGSPTARSNDSTRSGSPTSFEQSKESVVAARAALEAKFDAVAAAAKLSSTYFYQCNCWCIGWAEVYIRRPTGITSWIMKVQNGGSLLPVSEEFPLADVSTLLLRNRELDVDGDMLPSEDSSYGSSIGGDLDETQRDGEPEEGEGQREFDFDVNNLSLDFHQPELGLSPMAPRQPYGMGSEDGTVGPEFASALRHCLTYSNLGDLLPPLTRSNSAPDILSLVESIPKQREDMSTSPRSLAISVKEQSTHGPSSYKETSTLEKIYQEDEFTLRRESLSNELKEISEFNQERNGRDVTTEESSTTEVKKDTIAAPQIQPRFRRHTVGNEPGNSTPVATNIRHMLPTTIEGQSITEHSVVRTQASPSHITITEVDGQIASVPTDQQRSGLQSNIQSTQNEQQSTQKSTQSYQQSTQSNQQPTQSNQPSIIVQQPTTEQQQQSSQSGQQPVQTSQQSEAQPSKITQQQQQAVTPSKDGDIKPMQRPRGHTVAGSMLSQANQRGQRGVGTTFTSRDTNKSGGLSPSFVFLQLYYSSMFREENEKPLNIPSSQTSQIAQRAIKVLDRIPPYDTHKIGVLYVGPGQAKDEAAILSNVYGSSRYVEFLEGLGTLISLKDMSTDAVYTGGLDHSGADGKFAYWWHDDIMQVIFHVATLMPNKEVDPKCNAKKLHIGNDFVSIVYNESKEPYQLGTIKGQFNFAEIVIEPLDNETNLVTIQAKPALESLIGSRGARMISNKNLALLVRQVALHANLASQIFQSQYRATPGEAYTSNWLERLKKIRHIRQKVHQMESQRKSNLPSALLAPRQPTPTTSSIRKTSAVEDFTDYTY
ncbi:tuberin-like isoform X2 [Amphiura filiformis]|uniref:tuberin-like isoform X2 n=1 Tax=Amphiura filiformis TaxID=82378 RepID=UPI003B210CA2